MSKLKPILIGLAATGVGLAVYARWLRPWHLRWGATDEEVAMKLPGDELVSNPQLLATHAITIKAATNYIWPWLVQIGRDRGGFYSYQWLENLCGCQLQNAEEIHHEWQELKVGDNIWLHPKAPPLKVLLIEPKRALVLEKCWTFYLRPIDDQTSRLIIRNLGSFNPDLHNGLLNCVLWRGIFEPAHFIMERKMMLTIKRLAEQSYNQGYLPSQAICYPIRQ